MLDKKLILKLKKKTGLGMLDCKKALEEAGGDFPKAIALLAERSKHLAHKKLGRSIEQGIIFSKTNAEKNTGILMALGCETDFVARNEAFTQLAHKIIDAGLSQKPADKSSLLATKLPNGNSVEEEIIQQIGTLGENITIEESYLLEGPLLASYIHTGSKLGAMVVLNQAATTPAIQQAAEDMALHVVAMNPLAVDEKGIAPEVLTKERATIDEELQKENKPQEIKEKIAAGKMKKFISAHTLLAQPFFKDETISCQTYLNGVSSGLTLTNFKRIAIDS